MTLACQKDSYLQKLETKVVECEPLGEKGIGFTVILEDTILFPTGGGQPEDEGTINGIRVHSVKRNGDQVFHHTEEPLPVGEAATVVIDWERRFDHMQQHTGQHLITAVAESLLGYQTTSWSLGDGLSGIELDVPDLKPEEIDALEEAVNEKIRESIPVTVHLYEKDAPELLEVRARIELPDDHEGPVRVVNIEGVDKNTCCGTHVNNTAELQIIKLLTAEKGKKRKTHLFFIVGNRALAYMTDCFDREQELNSLLSCNADDHVIMVQKLQKSLRVASKNVLFTSRELAVLEAKMFLMKEPKPKFFAMHKKNAQAEFMSIFLSEVQDYKDIVFFLTVGDGLTGGQLILAGPDAVLREHGPKVCANLDGRGALRKGRYYGKFTRYSVIDDVEGELKRAIDP